MTGASQVRRRRLRSGQPRQHRPGPDPGRGTRSSSPGTQPACRGADALVVPGVGAGRARDGPAPRRRSRRADPRLDRRRPPVPGDLSRTPAPVRRERRGRRRDARGRGRPDGAPGRCADAPPHRLEPGRADPRSWSCSPASRRAPTSTSSTRTPASPRNDEAVLARTTHGAPFVSAIARGNVLGVQFHPERSGADGLRLLANVVELVRSGGRVGHAGRRSRPDAPAPRDPVPRRGERPGRQGHPVRRPRRRGRSARARRALRRRRRRRARLPRHLGRARGPRHAPRHRRADRPPGVHPADRRRRRAQRRRHAGRPAGRRRQGVAQHGGGRRSRADHGVRAAFGRQAVVVAIDAASPDRRRPAGRSSSRAAARRPALEAVAWADRAVALGAGELLVTSMDRDGTRSGYDTELLRGDRRPGRGPRHRLGRSCRSRGFRRRRAATATPMPSWPRRSSTAGSTRSRTVKEAMAEAGLPVRPVPEAAA